MRGLSPAFIDLFALLVVLFLLLPHRPDVSAEEEAHVGDLVVEISWCDHCHTDVDLWVRAPGDAPVGYSRTRGRYVSLMRDDLGVGSQAWRGEIAASRTLPDGEWAVNLHAYRDTGGNLPGRVEVQVWYRRPDIGRTAIWSGHATLSRVGEEVTVVRFTMQDGRFVPGSVHYSPIALRSAPTVQGGGL